MRNLLVILSLFLVIEGLLFFSGVGLEWLDPLTIVFVLFVATVSAMLTSTPAKVFQALAGIFSVQELNDDEQAERALIYKALDNGSIYGGVFASLTGMFQVFCKWGSGDSGALAVGVAVALLGIIFGVLFGKLIFYPLSIRLSK